MTDLIPAFVAVLLHADPTLDRALQLDAPAPAAAPARIRVATTFADAPAWDVYQLIDDGEWPERAVYGHLAIEPSMESHEC